MDSEEYYDSLDEESNYESLGEQLTEISVSETNHLKITKNFSKIPIKARPQLAEKVNEISLNDADDIIPFYDQSLSKSEIELKKMYLRYYGKDIDETNKKPKKKSKTKSLVHNGRLKSNSYLDMFYAKVGIDKNDLCDLSNRATCTDLSPKSYITCKDFDNASSLDLMEMESICSLKYNSNQEDVSLSLTSLDSKLCSVSQQNLKINNVVSRKKVFNVSAPVQVPELGKLGPEISKDKLELLKRRQEYGQKVSQKNKIKMMEKKLIKNLQNEIKESKKIA